MMPRLLPALGAFLACTVAPSAQADRLSLPPATAAENILIPSAEPKTQNSPERSDSPTIPAAEAASGRLNKPTTSTRPTPQLQTPNPKLQTPSSAPSATPRPKRRPRPVVNDIDTSDTAFTSQTWFSFLSGSSFGEGGSRTFSSLPTIAASPAATLTLATFDAGSTSGGVLPGATWQGQVTQNSDSITIGGTARSDNGWGHTSLNLDASGLGFINITAQRDPGHATSHLFLQFEDRAASTNTAVFSIDSTLFPLGSPATLAIAIGSWPGLFDAAAIGGWSIGGGGVGTTDFRMTLHNLELSATAIPEPSTYAALLGLAALTVAFHRRRRPKSHFALNSSRMRPPS